MGDAWPPSSSTMARAALPTIETAAGPPSRSLCGAPFSTTVPSQASRAVVRSAMAVTCLLFAARRAFRRCGALLGVRRVFMRCGASPL